MRVVILAHNLRAAGGASVGRNIVSALARVADAHEYLLIVPVGVGYEHVPKPSRGSCVYYRRRLGFLGQQVFEARTLPRLVRSFRPDIVWALGNFGLTDPGTAKQAVLLHKAQLVYDAHHQRGEAPRLRWVNAAARRRLRRSLPATQLVFCQTATMAQHFARAFQYRGRLALLPNAVSCSVDDRRASDRPAAWQRLAGKFVLFYLTRYYPHKNLEILVELFRRHAEPLRDVAVIITVSADQHPRAGQLLAALQEPLVREHIINVGPIDQSQLAAYYTHADAVIMPTLLESFSGTYLEAMRFDRPILTSDLDFAHDVCGPAAVYFAPLDPTAIRDAILHVKESDSTRAALVAAGRDRLQRYRDWDAIVLDAVRQLEQLGGREPIEEPRQSGVPAWRAPADREPLGPVAGSVALNAPPARDPGWRGGGAWKR